MSRVLLFVQAGDSRPKCYGTHQPTMRYMASCPQETLDKTYAAFDCWWLVECESAKDGRVIIATRGAKPGVLVELRAHGGEGDVVGCGRILASGGRR